MLLKLVKPIIVGGNTASEINIDENSVTAKTIRDSRNESNALNHTTDQAVDHLVCKIAGLMSHEMDSLTARDYLRLRSKISDFLDPSD